MFAMVGIVLLLVQGTLRLELLVGLPPVPFGHLLFGLSFALSFALALFGLAVDLKLRRSQLVAAPQLGWALAFVGWTLVVVALRQGASALSLATELAIPFALYLLISQGVQSFRALSTVAATLLLVALVVAAVGVHQGASPLGCVKPDPQERDASALWDGRACDQAAECGGGASEYVCEHVGLLGTSSVAGGRVRYRGALADPNELALALGVAVPFAFAFFARRRSASRFFLLLLTLGLVGSCVFLTRSRAGQLVLLTVLAVYLVERFGVRGLLAAVALAVPTLLFGGARPSAAPSSYALGETGPLGLFFFTATLYVSFKIIAAIRRGYDDDADAAVARTWALALLASLAGLAVGAFFMPFRHHLIYWIYLGLVGALYQATRAHDPKLEISFDRYDLLRLVAIDVAVLGGLHFYTTLRL